MSMPRWPQVVSVCLVLAAAAWLAWAGVWLLGAPFPERGMLFTVPVESNLHFEHGTLLATSSGAVRMLDFSAWWSLALGVVRQEQELLGCEPPTDLGIGQAALSEQDDVLDVVARLNEPVAERQGEVLVEKDGPPELVRLAGCREGHVFPSGVTPLALGITPRATREG